MMESYEVSFQSVRFLQKNDDFHLSLCRFKVHDLGSERMGESSRGAKKGVC